jgi:hypothetical protein
MSSLSTITTLDQALKYREIPSAVGTLGDDALQ